MALQEAAGVEDGGVSVDAFFAHQVRQNLHVALVMNTGGGEGAGGGSSRLAARLAANPSLHKHCTVVWCQDWTGAILEQVCVCVFLIKAKLYIGS